MFVKPHRAETFQTLHAQNNNHNMSTTKKKTEFCPLTKFTDNLLQIDKSIQPNKRFSFTANFRRSYFQRMRNCQYKIFR